MDYEVDCIYIVVCDPKKGTCEHPKRRGGLLKRKQKCILTINRLAECDYRIRRGKKKKVGEQSWI